MTSHQINFTKNELAKAPAPAKGKRDYYYDTKEQGLVMQVTPTGAKSFYLYKRIDGRPERVLLGKFPDLSIENARKLATQKKGEIAMGKNPQNERRAVRDEMTFGELFEMYMTRYSKVHKKSWIYDEREVNKFLSHWFNRKLSSFRKEEVLRLHTNIGEENGIYAANRLLERIRAIFNKAIEWGWDGQNPGDNIKKFREKSRDRFLQPDEMPRFFEALEQEENTTAADFFKICLFTGARKTNVLQMKWKDVSFDLATWRIEETKNGDAQTIPLSEHALKVLVQRKLASKGSSWVFPSPADSSKHLNDPKKAWARVLETAEIENLRIHDLRRTMGSYQASTGANNFTIQKTLGHKSQQSTAVYARMNLDPVREAVNKATSAMFDFSKQGDSHAKEK